MIDRRADRAMYRQVADDLRAQIGDGRLAPGASLRAEKDLAYDYDVAPLTVRRALEVLEREALIVRQAGQRARVAVPRDRAQVRVQRGSTVLVRAATLSERAELELDDGVQVVEVLYGGRPAQVYAADRTLFTFA